MLLNLKTLASLILVTGYPTHVIDAIERYDNDDGSLNIDPHELILNSEEAEAYDLYNRLLTKEPLTEKQMGTVVAILNRNRKWNVMSEDYVTSALNELCAIVFSEAMLVMQRNERSAMKSELGHLYCVEDKLLYCWNPKEMEWQPWYGSINDLMNLRFFKIKNPGTNYDRPDN